MQGLMDGTLDGATLTLDEVLTLCQKGVPLSIVLVMDSSVGADAIIAKKNLNFTQSSSLRIAVENTAVGGLMLQAAVEKNVLPVEKLEIIDAPNNQHVELWEAGLIDLSINYEPVTRELANLEGDIIFDSRQAPNLIFDVLAIRSDKLDQYRKTIRSLIQSHFLSLKHIQDSPQDAIYRIAGLQSVSPESIEKALSGVHFPSIAANHTLLRPDGALADAAIKVTQLLGYKPLEEGALEMLMTPDYLPVDAGTIR